MWTKRVRAAAMNRRCGAICVNGRGFAGATLAVYLDFYGLAEKPFDNSPNPRFLFMSSAHRDALAQLIYGVEERKGFVVLTGEVGTGKTTLLQALLDRIHDRMAVAVVLNSTLPFPELLTYVLADFGIDKSADSWAERLVALNHFLIERQRAGQNAALIIDEAQNLDARALEQVRLLSNFESAHQKLLQIVLVGQPELTTTLGRFDLRQLRQRIALASRIEPLAPAEVEQYIAFRLGVAGSRRRIFTDRAIRRIARYSDGRPRVVNTVCDHCLLIGYADQAVDIDTAIVDRAIRYRERGVRTVSRRAAARRGRWRGKLAVGRLMTRAGVGLAVSGAGIGAGWLIGDAALPRIATLAASMHALAVAATQWWPVR